MILILCSTHAGVNFPFGPWDPRPSSRHYLYLYVYNRSRRYLYCLFACCVSLSRSRCSRRRIDQSNVSLFYEQPMVGERKPFNGRPSRFPPHPHDSRESMFSFSSFFKKERHTCGHLTRQGFCFSRSSTTTVVLVGGRCGFPDHHHPAIEEFYDPLFFSCCAINLCFLILLRDANCLLIFSLSL